MILRLFLLFIICGSSFCLSEIADLLGQNSISSSVDCSFTSSEDRTCEQCVKKGSECFWCGGSTRKCLSYEWYFPNCPLDDVRHKSCWVNLSAVIIVVSILGGVILVILLSCICYCCCRCRQYRRQLAKKKGEKWQKNYDTSMNEMEARHTERSEQRKKELEAFRLKYGIKPSETPKSSKKNKL